MREIYFKQKHLPKIVILVIFKAFAATIVLKVFLIAKAKQLKYKLRALERQILTFANSFPKAQLL